MVVVCRRDFRDALTGEMHESGSRFEVDSGRLAAINGTKYGILVDEVPTEATRGEMTPDGEKMDQGTKEPQTEPQRRTRSRKKAKE